MLETQSNGLAIRRFVTPWVTIVLILINTIVFVWQNQPHWNDLTVISLYSMGANIGQLSLTGDYWRLLSAMFLHQSSLHFLFNMLALLIYGFAVEKFLGRYFYIFIYFASGLFSSFFSAAWNFHNEASSLYLSMYMQQQLVIVVSVGASGAISGLVGAILVNYIKTNPFNELIFDIKSYSPYVIGLFSYGFINSGIDNAAHFGGFIFGVIFALPWGFHKINRCSTKTMLKIYSGLTLVTAILIVMTMSNLYENHGKDKTRQKVLNYFNEQINDINTKEVKKIK